MCELVINELRQNKIWAKKLFYFNLHNELSDWAKQDLLFNPHSSLRQEFSQVLEEETCYFYDRAIWKTWKTRLNHSSHHMTVCGLSLHQGNTESRENLAQQFIFQIGTLSPHGINERFSFN